MLTHEDVNPINCENKDHYSNQTAEIQYSLQKMIFFILQKDYSNNLPVFAMMIDRHTKLYINIHSCQLHSISINDYYRY